MNRILLSASAFAALVAATPAHAIQIYESEDETMRLSLGGFAQPYFRWVANPCGWSSDPEPTCDRVMIPDGFGLNNVHLAIEGDYDRRGAFKVELRTVPNVELLELHLKFDPIDRLRVDAGRFKVPFSRHTQTSESQLVFDRPDYYRATPGRQLGVAAGVEVGPNRAPDAVTVWAGMFNGESDSERAPINNIDEDFLYVGRVEVAPFGQPSYRGAGDARPLAERREPILVIGGAMSYETRPPENDNYRQQNLGADLIYMQHGVFVGGELFHYGRDYRDDALNADKSGLGFSGQLAAFIPARYLREHLELAARVLRWDPEVARDPDRDAELLAPQGGSGPANPGGMQGRMAYTGGVNWYFFGHDLKLQAMYTHRVETEGYQRSEIETAEIGAVTEQVDDDAFILQLNVRL